MDNGSYPIWELCTLQCVFILCGLDLKKKAHHNKINHASIYGKYSLNTAVTLALTNNFAFTKDPHILKMQ